jgi:uncharacterized protein (TIGR03083 family)
MIETLHLFEPLDAALLALLRSLSREDWRRPTIAGQWTVRDVVAHLLDTPLRRLSFVRDGWAPAIDIRSDADLVAWVDAVNAEGVRTYGRLSPAVLIDLTAVATAQLRGHLRESMPDAVAAFAVSWAGETTSSHWFDVAREYTERWHHQAQIRLAVDALEPLMTPRFYGPVVATFMRALPHALADTAAGEGTCIEVAVEGDGGGTWHLTREAAAWRLDGPAPEATREFQPRIGGVGQGADGRERVVARVTIPSGAAWRLFTKGLAPDAVTRLCPVSGDAVMTRAILAARAIVG